MATAAEPNTTEQALVLLDQIMNKGPNTRKAVMQAALEKCLPMIEETLPQQMKGQSVRLVKRALLTFAKSDKLMSCTPHSFIRCVLDAAELGLAIDGRLAHAVPYENSFQVDGKWTKRLEAQFQLDYKGFVAVAKRSGGIVDCYAEVVRENDHFVHGRYDGGCKLEHTYDVAKDRGAIIAAYAVLRAKGGWRYELMQFEELKGIRARSKSYIASVKYKTACPWTTDEAEMCKKTVLKRGLKLDLDDPGLVRAIEMDDGDYIDHAGELTIGAHPGKASRSPLNDELFGSRTGGAESPFSDDDNGEDSSEAVGDTDKPPESQQKRLTLSEHGSWLEQQIAQAKTQDKLSVCRQEVRNSATAKEISDAEATYLNQRIAEQAKARAG